MYQTLLTALSDGILLITINRPDKLNALNKMVIEELGEVLSSAATDKNVHALIITGAGPKAFVAGADISEFLTLDQAGGTALAQKGQEMVFTKIEKMSKPVVAAVNGFALGGGCELAMACHFRMASENAKFGQPEVNLGLIPGYGGTQRLTQLIGKGKAMELMMTGNMIDAAEAKELGLVNHVTGADNLLDDTVKLLRVITSKGPGAVAAVIQAVNAQADISTDGYAAEVELFGKCFGTDEMKEGVSAFLEKRKPVFPR